MPGPWEKYQKTGSGPWMKYQEVTIPKTPDRTTVESALGGALQSASLGLADEITGGVKAAGDVLGDKYELKDLVERYQKNRDASRASFEKDRQDNPTAYTLGEIGGGVASAFIPGLGWTNAAKGASLGSKLWTAAKAGGAIGFGNSTADLTKGQFGDAAEDTLMGAGTGAATQGVLSVGGKVLKGMTPTNVGKKLANVFLNTPEEITETYMTNPKGVLGAPKRFELTQTAQGLVDKLKDDVVEGSAASRKILREEGQQVKGGEIADFFAQRAKGLAEKSEGVMDDPQKLAAYKWMQETGDKYRNIKNFENVTDDLGNVVSVPSDQVSTNRVKDLLQTIDRSVDYEVAPGKFGRIDEGVKKDIRSGLDQYLKGKSPAYAKQMEGVSKDARLLSEVSDITKNDKALTNLFRRIQTDENGASQLSKETLEKFDKRMGSNLLEQAKLSSAREAFDKSVTNGSMNVNKFSNMVKDVPVVKYLGPIIGASVDKYGRKMTMGAVDTAVEMNKFLQRGDVQSYVNAGRSIVDAAKKGNPAAILTFQMLSQSNPEALRYLNEQGEP